MIDLYCERTATGLWAEPVNVITNLAFFAAAFFALKLQRRLQVRGVEASWLVVLLVLIGIGSSAFHLFANSATLWMDVVPIFLFQLTFLWLYLRHVLLGSYFAASFVVGVFILTNALVGLLPASYNLNGSIFYGPGFLFLIVLAMLHIVLERQWRWGLLIAAGVFFVSVTLRTLDAAVCNSMPLGTHFFWHLLNGVFLYLLLATLFHNWGQQQPLGQRLVPK